MKFYFSYLVLIILFGACIQKKNIRSDYFPLEIGNKWECRYSEYILRRSVVSTEEHDGRIFYKVEEYVAPEGKDTVLINREILFCYDDFGDVYRRIYNFDSLKKELPYFQKHSRDGLCPWYKFDGLPGDCWTGDADDYLFPQHMIRYRITLLSTSASVTLREKVIDSCYIFKIESLSSSQPAYYEWLAKGIGIVRRSSSLNETGYNLDSYSVNNSRK
ncbi:MAG: hypothetical protein ABSB78_11530 [Bacteroidota bacterium]